MILNDKVLTISLLSYKLKAGALALIIVLKYSKIISKYTKILRT